MQRHMEHYYAINIFRTVKISMKFSSKEKHMKIVRTSTLFFFKTCILYKSKSYIFLSLVAFVNGNSTVFK
jgi:hypothetical protein